MVLVMGAERRPAFVPHSKGQGRPTGILSALSLAGLNERNVLGLEYAPTQGRTCTKAADGWRSPQVCMLRVSTSRRAGRLSVLATAFLKLPRRIVRFQFADCSEFSRSGTGHRLTSSL